MTKSNSTIIQQATITLNAAQAMLDAALAEARRLDVTVAVCVLNAAGHQKAFAAMDGTSLMALDAVPCKARTALIGMSSEAFAQALPHGEPVELSMASLPGYTLLGGGFPIWVDGAVVGALAVGGASTEEDSACARAALALLE